MRIVGLLILLLAGAIAMPACAQEKIGIPGPGGITLSARLFRPPGGVAGRGIVALHGCGGPARARDDQWAQLLASQGHPVLLPDSFGSRGLRSQCGVKLRDRVANEFGLRRQDALAAARWLTQQSFAKPDGVVLMGWSNGASTVLTSIEAGLPDLPAGLIHGAVAFYPGCAYAARKLSWQPAARLLVLIGASDDWTPAASCRQLASRIAPPALQLVVYPDSYHEFDYPDRKVRIRHLPGRDVHVGTNAAAREDALQRVPAFIAALD